MFKNSPIPIWVNIFLLILILFMSIQVYWFYFNHQSLIDAGITIEGVPNLNIIYTTAGRLVAMIAASVFVLITENPHQYLEPSLIPYSLMRTQHHQWLILWFTSWLLLLKSGHLSSYTEWQRKRVECLFESNGNPINKKRDSMSES